LLKSVITGTLNEGRAFGRMIAVVWVRVEKDAYEKRFTEFVHYGAIVFGAYC